MKKTSHPQQSTTKQSHWFFCATYASDEQLKEFANANAHRIDYMSYIVHNKDLLDDGTPKTEHKHLLIKVTTKSTITTVRNMFERACFVDASNKAVTTLVEYCESAQGSYEYMTHKNDPKKAQYNDSERVTLLGDNSIVERSYNGKRAQTDDLTFEILEALVNGVSKWTLAKKYGRDFILNYSKYECLIKSFTETDFRQAYENITAEEAVKAINEENEIERKADEKMFADLALSI